MRRAFPCRQEGCGAYPADEDQFCQLALTVFRSGASDENQAQFEETVDAILTEPDDQNSDRIVLLAR